MDSGQNGQVVYSKTKPPFEDVYNSQYFNVLRYVRKRVTNQLDAEDLVSDVFLYCYSHYDAYDPEKSGLSTWLYLVVSSRLKNYYRDHRTHTDISELENTLFSEGNEMENAVYLEELRYIMSQKISQLPEKQQIVVTMRYFQKYSFAEIAECLHTSEGNVRVILSRTLARLETLCADLI